MKQKLLCVLLTLTLLVVGTPVSASAVEVTIPTQFGDRLFKDVNLEHYFMTKVGNNVNLLLYAGELQFIDFVDDNVNVKCTGSMKLFKSTVDYAPQEIPIGQTVKVPVLNIEDWTTDVPLHFSKSEKEFDFVIKQPEGLLGAVGTESVLIMNILPTVVNITVPLNIAATIDVNEADGFVHGDIQIRNNTQAPVKVFIAKLASDNLPFENLIIPSELPKYLSWDTMGIEDSMRYFSLGIRAINGAGTPWKKKSEEFVYTYPNLYTTQLGVIEASSSSDLELDCFYGHASMQEKQFNFDVTFVAELEQ